MKNLKLLSMLTAGGLLIGIWSCQKTKFVAPPASFTVVHAMATGNAIVPRFGVDTTGKYYNDPTGNSMVEISYGGSQLYSPVAGITPFVIAPITDTGFRIFNGNLRLESGAIYSFFLSGDTTHADTMLVKDHIPYYSDSSAGVRFINLAIGGKTALTVNLVGDSGNLQFPPLAYKQITDFKSYPAGVNAGGGYSFEIRDQGGALLATYNWNYLRFANNTIVIAGSPDPMSPTPLNIFSVKNY